MSNENPITYEEMSEEHKQKYDEIKAAFEADLLSSFERTRHHGIRWKGFSSEGHSMKWIYLPLQKNVLGLSVKRSITWWLTHCIDIPRVW
jgi:hypothetical protein